MLASFRTIKIKDEVRLHIIKTDKFKTNLIRIYFQRPLIKEEITKNALLSMVLPRGTQKYQTSQEIAKVLEELYGASLSSDVTKKGERHIIQVSMQMANEKYLGEKNIINKGIKILNEVINHPLKFLYLYTQGDSFKKEYINQEKDNLVERIEGRKNDKMKYAYDRCIEEMCKNENFALYEYGELEELKEITGYALYEHYQKVLETSRMDICVVGDLEEKEIERLIEEGLEINRGPVQKVPREKVHNDPEEIRIVKEEMDVSQGKLTLGYRTNIPFESSLYYPLIVYSNILGGGPNSKLFRNVREKESLCYYVFSRIERFKSLMMIACGIEFPNYNKTIDLIKKQIEEMNHGNFSIEDIDSAKNSIITSIRSMTDSPGMLADFYYTQAIGEKFEHFDEIIDKIQQVDKNEIIQAGLNIKPDTVYFLKNKEEGR